MDIVRFEVNNNVLKEIHKIVVDRFTVTHLETAGSFANIMHNWMQTDRGKFVTNYAIDKPEFTTFHDPLTFTYSCVIIVELEKKKLSEFYLRFGNNGNNSTQ